jgi:hypothetical protein
MKSTKDYNGKVIIKLSTSDFGLVNDQIIDLLNNKGNNVYRNR